MLTVLRTVILGVALPLIVSGLGFFVALLRTRGCEPSGKFHWAGVAGLGAAYLSGHVIIAGWPPMPPRESTHWLFYIVLLSALLGVVDTRWTVPSSLRWSLRLVLTGLMLWLTLKPMVQYSWSRPQAAAWFAALGLAALLFWGLVDSLAGRKSGPGLTLCLLIVSVEGAALLGLSGSAMLGQLSGALAAALAPIALIVLWRPAHSLPRGAVAVYVMASSALWLNGYFYAELTWFNALLLTIAPLGAWAGHARLARRLGSRQAALIGPALAFAMLTPSLIAALVQYLTEDAYYY